MNAAFVRRAAAVGAVAALAAVVGSTAQAAPGASWQKVAPQSVGLDPHELDQIAATAKQGKSNCLVVVRDGKLPGEWYFNGTGPSTTQNIYSATKSFTSTLVGIAQDRGDLKIGQPAATWIPQWSGTASAPITVQQLLSMDSGRQWSFQSDYFQLPKAPDMTAYATGLGQAAAPGSVWTYNNAAVQTLAQVLRSATGQDVASFAQQRIFEPIGMTHTRMSTDQAGNAEMYEGIRSTCRDMARFGELMLDKGAWNGKRIVSSSWVAQATAHSSTALNAGYGYLWWLNHPGKLASPLSATSLAGAKSQKQTRGQVVPGAPSDLFWALGLGNQLIQVDPASKTVVVRLGKGGPDPQPPTFGPKEASEVVTKALTHAR